MEADPKVKHPTIETSGEGGTRILVVDDVAVNRELLKRWLVRRGFAITEVDNGQEAIRIGEEGATDLILLDIMMPTLSGTEVVKAIRRTRPKSELPIVMVSAKSFSDDVEESLDLGANAYITKPVDFKQLLGVIEEQMEMKRAADGAMGPD